MLTFLTGGRVWIGSGRAKITIRPRVLHRGTALVAGQDEGRIASRIEPRRIDGIALFPCKAR
ncbi:hypothetical protein V8J36_01635 [Frigidibacter sp. MR17.14]|uniref:hypothetical protein n=1 Tax=Frigidibacter sp. MR17.14 TaxID=3126509 RepID=UPI003012C51F